MRLFTFEGSAQPAFLGFGVSAGELGRSIMISISAMNATAEGTLL